ncbi:glycosyltransferase family 4 protein [Agrococcus sp. SL85]|uniref:glycosyltransferase family 4 protein n=1 Tax=Agrococcus sp. SL85 TaxID=2995141 RepID=UPI00226D11F1|nr:glycosyltransferase family 4 protein [Agrococcus sp. SL85]WAC65593.1 glycosyltransferase family 4 protein [Agrococcus sp. SL85]
MRVAYVCADPGIPVLGTKGASVHVRAVVRELVRRGHEVTVHCTRRGDGEASLLGGAALVVHPVAAGPVADRERAIAAAAAAIARAVAAEAPDLVYERYALFSDAAARIGAPSVLEVDAPLVEEQATHRELADAAGALATTRRALAAADVVACVSRPLVAWAEALGAARCVLAPNGVDLAAHPPRARRGGATLEAVFVGTIRPWHGLETAIEAMAGLEGVRLTVVGDGPALPALRERARALGASVRWLGALPHEAVPAVLAGMDAGLAPYPSAAARYFSPLKVVEYLAAGLAVVGSALPQVTDVVDDRTGLLVPPDDPAALAGALVALRDDRDALERRCAAARADAEARHAWSAVVDRILAAMPAGVRA